MKIIEKKVRRVSAKLARYVLRRNLASSPAERFRIAWEYLLSNRLYRWLIRIGQNPDREGTLLQGRTFELLSLGIPGFFDSTEIGISSNLKEAIDGGESFLVVHLHDGHRFISRVFASRQVTRIVEDPAHHTRWLSDQGIDVSRFHAVKDDVFSLMHLRKAIKSKHVIASVLDYNDARGRQAYINPAVLSFANAVGIPVFFAKPHVTDCGVATVISAGPYAGIDSVVCANMFLDFFNNAGRSRVSMKVKKYSEHSDWKMERRALDSE